MKSVEEFKDYYEKELVPVISNVRNEIADLQTTALESVYLPLLKISKYGKYVNIALFIAFWGTLLVLFMTGNLQTNILLFWVFAYVVVLFFKGRTGIVPISISFLVLVVTWIVLGQFPFYLSLVLVSLVVLYIIISKKAKKRLAPKAAKIQSLYKQQVLEKIVHFFGDHFTYQPNSGIGIASINMSKMFPNRAHGYMEDCIKGSVNNIDIEFSEVILLRGSKSSSNYGDTTTKIGNNSQDYIDFKNKQVASTERNMFRGLYLIADLKTSFDGCTVIRPKKANGVYVDREGSATSDRGQRLTSNGQFEPVHLENDELESVFNTYTTDQIEAQKLLTGTMIHNIKDFYQRTKKKFFISFYSSSFHLAIPYEKDLLDIGNSRPLEILRADELLDKDQVFSIYDEIKFILKVVEDFDLK